MSPRHHLPEHLRRVVVKLRDDVQFSKRQRHGYLDLFLNSVSKLPKEYRNLKIRPMFSSLEPGAAAKLIGRARRLSEDYRPPNFFSYLTAYVPPFIGPAVVTETFSGLDIVETAYVDASHGEPSVCPHNNPGYRSQGYLLPAPEGINAPSAWDMKGGDGQGVHFIDIERGWTLSHKDLLDAAGRERVTLLYGINSNAFLLNLHGTAVLGITVAADNDIDCIGIGANVSSAGVVSYLRRAGENLPDAILYAAAQLAPGDVLLLEVQSTDQAHLLPAEASRANFDAISTAVALGIVVVEPAGNGGSNLDCCEQNGRRILKRGDISFKDSGAIMVGAACHDTRTRAKFSNYGSRVDCFAWGDGVYTLSDPCFEGTSAAAAIVAGAAISVQGIAKAQRGGSCLTPARVRDLFSSTEPNSNTPSKHKTDRIGVMPNLEWIIEQV